MTIPAPRDGATCLVTGASSGLGEAFARGLSARGHHVTLVARRRERLERLAAELPGPADVLCCDLGDAGAREQLIDAVERAVDVLINNAGFGTVGRYLDASAAREREMIAVNVEAPVALCRAFVPPMVARGSGAVLNVSSIAAFQPLPGVALYAGTKAMLLTFTAGLHAELAHSPVTVAVMCSGGIRTEFAEVAGGAGLSRLTQRMPSALWKTPEDVAEHGLAGLQRGRWLIVPGRTTRVAAALGRHVPRPVIFGLSRVIDRRR